MVILAAETKSLAGNFRKPPGGGVFIFASLAENNRKKTPPPWGFCRETPVSLLVLILKVQNFSPFTFFWSFSNFKFNFVFWTSFDPKKFIAKNSSSWRFRIFCANSLKYVVALFWEREGQLWFSFTPNVICVPWKFEKKTVWTFLA